MKRIKRFSAVIAVSALVAVPGFFVVGGISGAAPPSKPGPDWGQAVKVCNETACYPGGTSRGGYVTGQATDTEGPGYGSEIQNLAPIPADPGPFQP